MPRADSLLRPVCSASLRWLSVAFAALVAFTALRFMAKGWVDELLLTPHIRLYYPGLSWVPHPGRIGCYALLVGTFLSASLMAFGVAYRASAFITFVLFTWSELLEASTYLNHYYLVSTLLLLLAIAPKHRRGGRETDASQSLCIPLWTLWLFRAQVAVVYVYAGIAKLQTDWLLQAEPLRTWLFVRSELPLIGPLLALPEAAYVFSWAGAAYDLTIVGWLLWRPSRPFAWLTVVAFHTLTWVLFRIGLFPLIMVAASTLFFQPDWPTRAWRRLRRGSHKAATQPQAQQVSPVKHLRSARWRAWLCAGILALHWLLPLRQWFYPGNRLWTEQGFRFAWNVMLIEKVGQMEFNIHDPVTGRHWQKSARQLLSPLQLKTASTQPDLILQVAHALGNRTAENYGLQHVEVFADVWVTLNGRPRQRLIDPNVDLMRVTDSFAHKRWIVPLHDG